MTTDTQELNNMSSDLDTQFQEIMDNLEEKNKELRELKKQKQQMKSNELRYNETQKNVDKQYFIYMSFNLLLVTSLILGYKFVSR
jgi:uncharacterized membrane protein (DUF106 family)